MKRITLFLFVAIATMAVSAQNTYVGGSLGLWRNDDDDVTSFLISPEIGFNLNDKWALGTALMYAHVGGEKDSGDGFVVAPYTRFSFYQNESIRLFVDGGFGFATSKVKGGDSSNGCEVGLKPGIAISLNKKMSLVAKYGFLGYRDNYVVGENGYGLGLKNEELSFGFFFTF